VVLKRRLMKPAKGGLNRPVSLRPAETPTFSFRALPEPEPGTEGAQPSEEVGLLLFS
jgi:hypothetical protein